MFQTEINALLQELNATWFLQLMLWVSKMGMQKVLLFFIFFFVFFMDYRKGFVALQCLLWANLITLWLKDFISLPRPWLLDNSLRLFEAPAGQLRLVEGGAPSFFSALPNASLETLREAGTYSNGFPSGHVSLITAYWGSIAIQISRKWLSLFVAGLIILTMVSRIYLAQHFLADVLAGLLIGIIPLVFITRWLINKGTGHGLLMDIKSNAIWIFILMAPLILLLLPESPVNTIGQLIGLNIGTWLICRNGFPESQAPWWKRLLRFVLAVGLFILATHITSIVIPDSQTILLKLLKPFIEMSFTYGMATWLAIRTGLFQ